jgi:hypothetical protein
MSFSLLRKEWKALGNMSKEEAQQQYVNIVKSLDPDFTKDDDSDSDSNHSMDSNPRSCVMSPNEIARMWE